MNEIDPKIVLAILAFAGIGVTGLTEMLKRMFKVDGVWAYVVSFAVSGAATAFILIQASTFAVLPMIVYTIVVFLEANGLYKVIKK